MTPARPRLRAASEPGEGELRPVRAAKRSALLIGVIITPLAALLAAVPVAWGWGVTFRDLVLTAVMYVIGICGITLGYHRLFTHRSFKAGRVLRIVLALAGGCALEGSVVHWVAEHRRHHRYADAPGDPHSPWLYGESGWALLRGLAHAQVGWFWSNRERADFDHWAPDVLADSDLRALCRFYPLIALASWLLPPLAAGLWAGSWQAAFTAFFWASLVRYALVHHATWAVNSVAHTFGTTAFVTRDQSRNVPWVALLTLGEGWHNYHHADPTSARHGVLPGQLDPTARLIRVLEWAGLVRDVRWPTAERIAARRLS
ncbi:acyl-CoA desaturase [Streptomyces sp. NPDC087300]|uniref:acyl-CoA desaturase n=1 Tax=Streptomyces sp. NPDC087300 TaxID=3365780 RepID=UPI00380BD30B